MPLVPGTRGVWRTTLTLRAMLELSRFVYLSKVRGFAAMRTWIVETPVVASSTTGPIRDALIDAVERVCVYLPFTMRCLGRAAIATRLLRANGVRAEMVIGVSRMPFNAHTWVELSGEPIFGLIDRHASYRVIDRI